MRATGVFRIIISALDYHKRGWGKLVDWELEASYMLWVSITDNALERELR